MLHTTQFNSAVYTHTQDIVLTCDTHSSPGNCIAQAINKRRTPIAAINAMPINLSGRIFKKTIRLEIMACSRRLDVYMIIVYSAYTTRVLLYSMA